MRSCGSVLGLVEVSASGVFCSMAELPNRMKSLLNAPFTAVRTSDVSHVWILHQFQCIALCCVQVFTSQTNLFASLDEMFVACSKAIPADGAVRAPATRVIPESELVIIGVRWLFDRLLCPFPYFIRNRPLSVIAGGNTSDLTSVPEIASRASFPRPTQSSRGASRSTRMVVRAIAPFNSGEAKDLAFGAGKLIVVTAVRGLLLQLVTFIFT